MAYNFTLPKLGDRYDTRITSPITRLSADERDAADLALELVSPRPDAETSQYELHRVAFPGMPYWCPLVAKGGTDNHIYILVSGPTGLTVVSDYNSDNDGMVHWDNPTAGTHEVIVRIVDQFFGIVTARWTFVCGTGNHIFIDDVLGNDTTGDGSDSLPYKTIDKVFVDATTTNINANKTIVAKSGATPYTYTFPTYYCNLAHSVGKPRNFIGDYRAATRPKLDHALGKLFTLPTDGATVANVNFTASPGDNSGVKDSRYVQMTTATARCLIYHCNADNMVAGDSVTYPATVGNDNPCAFFTTNTATIRQHCFIGHNTMNNSANAMYILYSQQQFVARRNKVTNSKGTMSGNGDYAFRPKWDIHDATFCNEEAWDGVSSIAGGVFELGLGESNTICNNVEVKRCKIGSPSENGVIHQGMKIGFETPAVVQDRNVYITRNTIHGEIERIDRSYNCVFKKNITVSDYTTIPTSTANFIITKIDNLESNVASTPLDANYDLTGADRTTYLGIRGEELR